MAEWCAQNLRDCEGWNSAGLSMSTTSNESCKLYDGTLRQIVSWSDCEQLGGIHQSIGAMLAADPTAVLPRALYLGLNGLGTDKVARVDQEFADDLKQLEEDAQKYGNKREQKHARGAALWGRGYHRAAVDVWDEILVDYPTDLMAVKFAHDGHFFMGDARGKKNSVEKVLPQWDPTLPCYSYLHGMYAFGLEECGEYEKAEKEADKALSLNRFDAWATHAKAHVMEMNARYEDGLKFMYATEEHWKPAWIITAHNYWHTALFHIEKEEYEAALEIFDREISLRYNNTDSLLDMVDASALLWRLELQGVDVGLDRWKSIRRLGNHIDEHSIVFNDVHMGPVLYRQGDRATADQLYASLRAYSGANDEDNSKITEKVGLPLYEGMLAFAEGHYDTAAEKIFPVRKDIVTIGGSHAQRDVFSQTLIEACILSSKKENWQLTTQLLNERNAFKKESPLGQRYAEKFRLYHGAQ